MFNTLQKITNSVETFQESDASDKGTKKKNQKSRSISPPSKSDSSESDVKKSKRKKSKKKRGRSRSVIKLIFVALSFLNFYCSNLSFNCLRLHIQESHRQKIPPTVNVKKKSIDVLQPTVKVVQ